MSELLIRAAQEAIEAGDLDVARLALLRLPPPSRWEATLLVAEIELARGDVANLLFARGRLEALLARPPEPLLPYDRARAEVLLGATLSSQGEYAAAQPHFARGIAMEPELGRGEYGAAYATTLIELSAWKEAWRYIERLDGVEDAQRIARCRWFRRQHRPAEGLSALRPDDGPAWDVGIAFEAACCHRALGEDAAADRWCETARRVRQDWFVLAVAMEPEAHRPCTLEEATR